MISKRAFEQYCSVLKMGESQVEQTRLLYDAYVAGFQAEQTKMRDAITAVQRSSEDSGDHTVFMEKMPAIQKEYSQQTQKLEKDFFRDVRSTLASEQETAWPRVERMRRRDVELRGGSMSGESLDLVTIATNQKLISDGSGPVDQLIEGYEADMDRLLAARAEQRDNNGDGFEPGKPIDIEKIQAQLAKSKEAGAKVRDLNKDYVRKLEALLTPEQLPGFQEEVKKATFPRVYRTPRVMKEIEAALAMSDLTAEQRETLTRAKESYVSRAVEVNSNWSKAITENEEKGAGGTIGGGGNQISLSMGDDPEDLKNARKARRELDDGLAAEIKRTLTQEQHQKLPKPEEDEMGEFRSGRGMMIRRGE